MTIRPSFFFPPPSRPSFRCLMDAVGQVKVDEKLPTYKPVAGVSGSIKSVGSDTMNNLMTLWGEGFRKYYPSVKIEIEGKGSNTAPPAPDRRDREFRSHEPADEAERNGRLRKENTATNLWDLPPASTCWLSLFTRTIRSRAYRFLKWIQFFLHSKTRQRKRHHHMGANRPDRRLGKNAAGTLWPQFGLGTYSYFKEHALGKGDFKDTVKDGLAVRR